MIVFLATVPMGLLALYFAVHENQMAVLVALILSVYWGAVAVGLLAMRFSTRRVRADMRVHVVEQTVECFLKELQAPRPNESDADGASQRAELVDRLDRLASKALENVNRRA